MSCRSKIRLTHGLQEQGTKSAFIVSELIARLGQSAQTKEALPDDELIAKDVAAVAVEGTRPVIYAHS